MAAIPATSPRTNPARRWNAAAAIIGGLTIVTGAAMPWLSTLAGLHTLTGLDGANGRILAGGGAVAVVLGIVTLRGKPTLGTRVTPLFGFVLLAFAGWLLLALLTSYRQLATDPFTLARLGPGLFVATAGAAVVFSPLLRRDSDHRDNPRAAMRTDALTISIAASSLLAGLVHLALSGDHWSASRVTATAFTAVGLVQIALAAAMAGHASRRLLVTAIAVHGGAVLAWVLAESGLLPFLHTGDHHGQRALVATIAAETVVVFGAMTRVARRQHGGRDAGIGGRPEAPSSACEVGGARAR